MTAAAITGAARVARRADGDANGFLVGHHFAILHFADNVFRNARIHGADADAFLALGRADLVNHFALPGHAFTDDPLAHALARFTANDGDFDVAFAADHLAHGALADPLDAVAHGPAHFDLAHHGHTLDDAALHPLHFGHALAARVAAAAFIDARRADQPAYGHRLFDLPDAALQDRLLHFFPDQARHHLDVVVLNHLRGRHALDHLAHFLDRDR